MSFPTLPAARALTRGVGGGFRDAQLVTDRTHRKDILGLAGVILQRLTQPADMHVQGSGVAGVISFPNLLEELLPPMHFIGLLHHIHENSGKARGQMRFPAVARDHIGTGVELQRTQADEMALPHRLKGAHAIDQLLHRKGQLKHNVGFGGGHGSLALIHDEDNRTIRQDASKAAGDAQAVGAQ